MAKRPVYFIKNSIVCEREVKFEWFAGFAISQKQKSINSLHSAIKKLAPDARPLEISTKGTEPLGVKLSAFNLKLDDYPLECVFQSSKVFDDTNAPHTEWLTLHPKEAKGKAASCTSSRLLRKATCFLITSVSISGSSCSNLFQLKVFPIKSAGTKVSSPLLKRSL